MRIGTLGAGQIATAVARHALRHGHEVVSATAAGRGRWPNPAVGDLVLPAVPWPEIPDAVRGLGPFDGRIVMDATNQFEATGPKPRIADLGDLTGSEYVASLLPGARVVKVFNTVYGRYIEADPRHDAGRQVLFLAGDDADAVEAVRALVEQFGFAAVPIGDLRNGGRLMQLGGPLSALHLLKQD
ncbi:NADP oxidoreductase [Streptomyces sp. 5-6(2022)]|uniref:NADPH-dependent F420 reductase n=1 Tax=Streptomyces sp. 5-6(2022) TaxID=2936510 RepID=UPI0023B96B4D|nr:NADP oxidoreductase [Streptomyces sp. 5-6(2022)]